MPRRLIALLTLALVVPAVALAATGGTYRGTIDEGGSPVTVKVKNGKLKKFKASIYASCGLSNFLITVAYPPAHKKGATKKIKNNKFKVVFSGDPSVEDDKRTVKGRFNGDTVTGSIKVEGPCSASGTYTAKR